MKPAELRALTNDQLEERLGEVHEEGRGLRFQEAAGKVTATARTREMRKTIARIHTIRTEPETESATRAYLAQTGRGGITPVAR